MWWPFVGLADDKMGGRLQPTSVVLIVADCCVCHIAKPTLIVP
jgi:hypothetical protein